jgi:hypothetical protein
MPKPETDPRGPGAMNELRGRIRALRIIRTLERHVLDGAEMKPTQVTAAVALLRHALPGRDDGAPALSLDDALKELE